MAVDAKYLKDLMTVELVADIAYSLGEKARLDGGGRYHIHCPGHLSRLGKADRRDSSCVLTEKGYHCFSCGESVDVFQMVQELTGWGFPDCVAYVAKQAGVEDAQGERKIFPLSKTETGLLGLSYEPLRDMWEKNPAGFLREVRRAAEETKKQIRQKTEMFCRKNGEGALFVYEICEQGGSVDEKVWCDLENSFNADVAEINEIMKRLGL